MRRLTVAEVRVTAAYGAVKGREDVVIRIVPEPFVPGLGMAADEARAQRDADALFGALRAHLGGMTFDALRERFRTAPGYGQENT